MRFVALAAALAAVGLAWPGADAGRTWPGGLDPTFADGGGTFVDGGGTDFPIDVVNLPTGGTLTLLNASEDIGLLKLGADGSRDQTFGDDGFLIVAVLGRPVEMQLVAGGKILVLVQDGGANFAFHRYTADGAPDATFGGGDGVVEPSTTQGSQWAGALAVQPDGKLVVAGMSPYGTPSAKIIWRFNADGSPDAVFGTGGRAEFPSDEAYDMTSVAVQSDGRIAAGAMAFPTSRIYRVTSTGAIDQSFGTQGVLTTAAYVRDLIQAPDGGLLYTGRVGESETSHVYKLTAPGAAAATSAELPGEAFGLAPAPDGRVLAVGIAPLGLGYPSLGFVARLTSTLAFDTTFADEGLVGFGFRDTSAWAATVQPDNRIVVAAADRDPQHIEDADVVVLGVKGGYPFGLELDGWGGLHPLSSNRAAPATSFVSAPYWQGWDIARGVELKSDATGGYELDGWGGIHSFGINGHAPPARVNGGPYWPGWDIARDIAILPDETGGYVLDGWGALHPFGLDGHAPPPRVTTGPSWVGWDIARGLDILPDGSGGYVLDGWGGIHPFAIGDNPEPDFIEGGPYWAGWDIARDVEVRTVGGAYVLDGWGGIHSLATYPGEPLPPTPTGAPYWRGWDISRSLSMP